jgi:hypothetical protein
MIGRIHDGRGEFMGNRRRMAAVLALAAVTVLTGGCSSGRVVTTDDAPLATPTSSSVTPTSARRTNDDLANAFDYYAQPASKTGYYFTTPSKRWVCAIFPREKAGCQSSTGSTIPINGAPNTVPDAHGDQSAPNAIQVDEVTDAQFASLEAPGYDLVPGPAAVLPFNKVLSAAGFRCNVQEASGVSCGNELTGKGFTFSADGYTLQYTDLPA